MRRADSSACRDRPPELHAKTRGLDETQGRAGPNQHDCLDHTLQQECRNRRTHRSSHPTAVYNSAVSQRIFTQLGLLALAACSSTTVVDRPDGTVPWPTHRMAYGVPDGGLGLVSNSGSDEVSLLDLGAGKTLATLRVGIQPLGNDGPHHLAVDPAAGRVYVALS